MLTVQEKISLLLWDRRYIKIPNDIDVPNGITTLVMVDPTLEDKNYYLHVKACEAQACSEMEIPVPTEEDVFSSAREAGFWTEMDDKVIQETDEHIEFLESELARQKFQARKRSLNQQIEQARIKYNSVLQKKENLKLNSAEYLAHEHATFCLLQRIVYNLDGTLFWPTEQQFVRDKERYLPLVIYIAHEFLNEGTWSIADIREVARSGEWRILWASTKDNLVTLFNKNVGALNLNQKMLVYWSRVYDSVFEDPNRPDQDVISDDDLLDEWLANRDLDRAEKEKDLDVSKHKTTKDHQEQMQVLDGYYVETCTCGASNVKVKGLGEKPMHAVDCPYGTWRRYTLQEKEELARQIYGRNTNRVRQLINSEQDAVESKGVIEEHHLRHRKSNSRKILNPEQKIIPIRR
jgi:hypothetical protein